MCHASVRVRPGDAPDTVAALLGDEAAAGRLRAHPEGSAAEAGQLELARAVLPAQGEGLVVVVGRHNVAESAAVVEEVGAAVAFLVSPRASWISGASVPVDGCQSRSQI